MINIRFLLTVGVLGIAASGFAQKEQWLTYHTSREGRAYRYIEASTNPPPKVALPKLSGVAWFGKWTTPLEPDRERWVCLDQAKKGRLCDRLIFDVNGNGRLDDDPAIAAYRMDEYTAYFDPVKLVFKGEDGPFTFHIVFQFSKYSDDGVNLLATAGGWYQGVVDFAGKKHRVELVDGNVNATFNDVNANAYDSDRVQIEKDTVGERFLGKMLEIDGQFFGVEVARDGAFIKVRKLDNVAQGKVQVQEAISQLTVFGSAGHYVRKPEKGALQLPAGDYTVMEWSIKRKDAAGIEWTLNGSRFPDSARLAVKPERETSLDIGEPVRASLTAHETTNQVSFNLSFQGKQGESIGFQKGTSGTTPGPKLTLASQDGVFRATNSFEFG